MKKCTTCGAPRAWRPLQKPTCASCQRRAAAGRGSAASSSRGSASDSDDALFIGAVIEPIGSGCDSGSYGGDSDSGSCSSDSGSSSSGD